MKPPKTFVAILAVNLLLGVIGALTSGSYYALAPLAVWVVFAWKALRGSQAAAYVIGGLFGLSAVVTIYSTVVSLKLGPQQFVPNAIAAVILLAVVAYIFFSPALKSFYAESAKHEYGAS